MKTYAPNKEDKVIVDYFHHYNGGNTGRFVDIGSYDPITLSCTRALIDHGWNGIYLNPNPQAFVKFKNTYGQHRHVITNYALGQKEETILIQQPSVVLDRYDAPVSTSYAPVKAKTITINKFLSQHGFDIDFLCINLHALSYQTLQLFPQEFLHRLKMLCIAHENLQVLIEKKLQVFGFKTLLVNNEYLIMAK